MARAAAALRLRAVIGCFWHVEKTRRLTSAGGEESYCIRAGGPPLVVGYLRAGRSGFQLYAGALAVAASFSSWRACQFARR